MSEKLKPIDIVLNRLNFTEKEKKAFHGIIKAVKSSQNVVAESPKNTIDLIVEDIAKS